MSDSVDGAPVTAQAADTNEIFAQIKELNNNYVRATAGEQVAKDRAKQLAV